MRFKVESINISDKKGIQKRSIKTAVFIKDFGIKDDAHAGKWDRQVSFLSGEAVNTMRAQAGDFVIKHGDFGENIVTRGIDWTLVQVGGKIIIGEVEFEVTQIGKECHTGCAIYEVVGHCIMPKQGIFAKVIKGGHIHAGDSGYYSL
jgi:MOSC domain-containing protein YiiM